MSQTRRHSLVEAIANVLVGIVISFISNRLILGHYGIPMTLKTNAIITAWFTAISIGRSYTLRRIFNRKNNE
jgi:hypothetical protein